MTGKKWVLLAVLVCLNILVAADFEPVKWRYYKDIQLIGNYGRPVKAVLDVDVLSRMNPDGSDIRVVSGKGEEPYKLFLNPSPEIAHAGKIIDASSTQEFRGTVSFKPAYMLDGVYDTTEGSMYQCNALVNQESCWFTVDLQSEKYSSQIKIWASNQQYTWTHIQVEGSNDNKNWQLVKKKAEYNYAPVRVVYYPPVKYRYLRFTLWHTQTLMIGEIEIYGTQDASILIMAEKNKSYRLYYGNALARTPTYDLAELYQDISTPAVTLGAENINPSLRQDIDFDGMANEADNCPETYNQDQSDADNDAVGDACDNCPLMYNPDQYDDNLNGIGFVCDDNDHDGFINLRDNCVGGYNPDQKDRDNNGVGDACEDYDNDTLPWYKDNCVSTANPGQEDRDKDGIGDTCDNCPDVQNKDQQDSNGNGVGDACEDEDSDTIANRLDNCLKAPNKDQKDSDSDGLGDVCDNCIAIKNPDQADSDRNGVGDICDDKDNDGVINSRDNCIEGVNPYQKDSNNDGVGDACDDVDHDGVQNYRDNCQYVVNPSQRDDDHDGTGNECDSVDDRVTEKNVYLGVGLAALVVVLLLLGYRLSKKPVE